MVVPHIHEWIEYIQIPQANLNNLPICPYAKTAIVNDKVLIEELISLDQVRELIENVNTATHWVAVFYYQQYTSHTVEELSLLVKQLNVEFKPQDKVILDNDPRTPFSIGDVQTSFDGCYLLLVQSLSDLTIKSNQLKNNTNYYSHWSQKGLDEVVSWR